MREPEIHSHVTDELPENHPLAYETIYCDRCGPEHMLHAINNECMDTWVETGAGNYGIVCWVEQLREEVGEVVVLDKYALP